MSKVSNLIGILIPNNLWFCPYVTIYTKILDAEGFPYEIVSWCRDGKDEKGCVQFKDTRTFSNNVQRIIAYYRFSRFVKRTVVLRQYEKLIVFTPQLAFFIARLLKRNYYRKYIFDYRDLSIEQTGVFKRPFATVLKNSAANVISSPGFKTYLPRGLDYILSHNFNIDMVRNALRDVRPQENAEETKYIDVLTIGGIRDYSSNVQVIDALASKTCFTVRFVGRGHSAEALQAHAVSIGAHNVSFAGFYPKEKEAEYIVGCTFMNIFYPRQNSHDMALSNRFYSSLIYKKPMITTADTLQGNYTRDYQLGVAVKDCEGLDVKLKDFLEGVDKDQYAKRCNDLLASFVADYDRFENMVKKFIS